MDCRYCSKSFSKGEHLVRHERSHTGLRPFVCAQCSRPFARQDSLARHQKLHRRRDTGVFPTSPSNQIIQQSLPSPLSSSGDDAVNQASTQSVLQATPWERQGGSSEISQQNENEQTSVFLDFDLIWPDSEQLFESLMALDNTNARLLEPLSDPPVSSLGLPQNIPASSRSSQQTTSLMGANTSGESHRAVHNVSEMVTAISSHVTSAVEATSVTSVFLDECLHMFFERFIPTFPILHRATFVFRDYSQPLLLNAMAIGSLYLGPKSAVSKGEALWRLAHVAVTTSWEKLITHRGVHDTCSGVQLVITALLSQAYGALSKNRAIRTTSQAFHALGFYWARQCATSDTQSFSPTSLPSLDSSEDEKNRCWHAWAAKEVHHRALLGHYLLDGLLSRTTGEPSSVRHSANSLGLPSTEEVFNARTATEWLPLFKLQRNEYCSFRTIINSLFQPANSLHNTILSGPAASAFSLRVVLEGLQSFVSDCDNEDVPMMGVPTKMELRRALSQVYSSICKNQSLTTAERLETLLRWHTICLDTCKDSSTLCLSICARYNITQYVCGSHRLSKNELDLVNWVDTEDARRALLHAISIQDIVEQLPRGRAHVIHIPSSLFAAAAVYCVFSLGGRTSVEIPNLVNWEDVLSTRDDFTVMTRPGSFDTSETTNYIRGHHRSAFRSIGTNKNLLYELNSMQKLFRCLCSQWGIAYDMEDVIDQWNSLCH